MRAFSLVFVVLGMAAGDPAREEVIKTSIDRNVQWLLTGIRDGSLEGPDLARAVVALFLAEPGFFSPGHEIELELGVKINSTLLEAVSRSGSNDDIPSEELALYLQALLVSCKLQRKSKHFLGREPEVGGSLIWSSVAYKRRVDRFPSSAMLSLCNLQDRALQYYAFMRRYKGGIFLTDELEYLPMTMECMDSFYCKDEPSCKLQDEPVRRSGYNYYPLNLTIADLQEMIERDDDLKPLIFIAAAMQIIMHRNRLQVSDLPSAAVDFLLKRQDEDGSWGQSALNSFFVLPVLSNRSFLNITDKHCSRDG